MDSESMSLSRWVALSRFFSFICFRHSEYMASKRKHFGMAMVTEFTITLWFLPGYVWKRK
ncbi:MAG: hypothetical protein LBT40_08790 [Deltaproteobacteria bacterium]|nr:hypothetical protein [Deltaproteobacteria bacterium]